MARTRQPNVHAAQWSPNGTSLGTPDLTAPGAAIFGENVFGPAAQRLHLPKDVFRQLQHTIERGAQLDSSIANVVAQAMKEWAIEKGATHYTHWFQPLTGSTAEKHDSFFNPAGDGSAIAEFSGSELIRGEPDASSFPTGGIRATFEARGYTAWDPTSPAFILRNPNGSFLCIPTAFASWTGEALDHKIPLLRSMDALVEAPPCARSRLFGDDETQRVFTTIGPEQEYFLIDEQYYYERPDLITTGRTLFGAKPPKGHELDDHYFGSIPERILAYMLDVEDELARLGVPIKTRHNEVAPNQYEVAPMFENSNVGSDHQQLCMQIMQIGRPPLRPGVPAAREAVRRRQRLGQAQQLVDGHRHRAATCWSPATTRTTTSSSCSSRPPSSRPSTSTRACCARRSRPPARTTASAPTRRRRRSSRSSSAASSRRCSTRSPSGKGGETTPESVLGLGTPVLPPLPMHGGDRNRTSPFAFTGNKFEFRALGSSMSPSFPNTVLNTIVAEAIDDLADELEAAAKAARPSTRSSPASSASPTRPTARSSSAATTTTRRGTRRPEEARPAQPPHHPGRPAAADLEADDRGCSATTAC